MTMIVSNPNIIVDVEAPLMLVSEAFILYKILLNSAYSCLKYMKSIRYDIPAFL
jgi:hypothetical protein